MCEKILVIILNSDLSYILSYFIDAKQKTLYVQKILEILVNNQI